MIEIAKTVVVIRRHDGKYFQGCGYGGPGNPVPYWSDRIWEAKVYKTEAGARKTAKQVGGYPGYAVADKFEIPKHWVGFLVWQRQMWKALDVAPADFDPNDYEGNNGPLG